MAGIKNRIEGRSPRLSLVLYVLSLAALVFALVSLGWAVWPSGREVKTFTIPAGTLPGAQAGETYASLAEYTLQVSWPRWIRAGEAGEILVVLSEIDSSEESVLDRETQVILIEPSIIRLPLDPPGRTQINLGAQQALRQTWTVQGAISGEFPGKLVVSFGFYDEALGELAPVPVAVVDLTIRVVTLWGLARGLAVWLGVVGLALWGALFLLGRVVAE